MTNRGTEPKSHEVTEACWRHRGGGQEFRQARLDAAGEHLEVGGGRKIAGNPEGDDAAVGEDRDPGAERGRDRNVRDDFDEPAAHPV
jgi:hypothetical protein